MLYGLLSVFLLGPTTSELSPTLECRLQKCELKNRWKALQVARTEFSTDLCTNLIVLSTMAFST